MKKLFLSIVLGIMLFNSGCKREDNSTPISSTNQKREQELLKILTEAKSASLAPAIMLSVARPSKNWKWSGALGKANIGSNEIASTAHRWRVASVTKMFTAASIMLLVEENKISLDDNIGKHLDTSMMAKISSRISNANSIKVRNLLNHTSSLGEYTGTTEFLSLFPNTSAAPTREQVIDIGLQNSPAGDMGTWKYSNTGYSLLSLIIEKVSGKPYRTFVKERILDPLKMNNSYFSNDEFMIKPFLTPYFTTTPPATEQNNFALFNCNWAIGTGDLISSQEDLQTFLQALMQGKIVSNQSLQLMKNNGVPSAYTGLPSETYGLGLIMAENPDFIGHAGDLFGIHTKAFYLKSIDTYIITAVNQNDQDDQVFEMMGKVKDWIEKNDK
jgi:D-alanyl-D-alanine carboxypeptidase